MQTTVLPKPDFLWANTTLDALADRVERWILERPALVEDLWAKLGDWSFDPLTVVTQDWNLTIDQRIGLRMVVDRTLIERGVLQPDSRRHGSANVILGAYRINPRWLADRATGKGA